MAVDGRYGHWSGPFVMLLVDVLVQVTTVQHPVVCFMLWLRIGFKHNEYIMIIPTGASNRSQSPRRE